MKPFFFEKSLGVDIREEAVALCLMGKKLRGVEVIGTQLFETAALGPGAGAEVEQRLINRITQFLQDYGGAAETLILSLPRRFVSVKTFSLPAPDRQTVDSMVGFELERHFATVLEELYVSYHVVPEQGNRFQITAAGIRRETADYYLDLLQRAGLKPAVLDVSTFANLNLLAPATRRGNGVEAMLDLSPSSCEVCILNDGTIELARSVPVTEPGFRESFFRHDLGADHFQPHAVRLTKFLTEVLQSTLYSCTHLDEEDGIDRIHLFGGGEFADSLAREMEEETGVLTPAVLPPAEMRRRLPAEFDPATQNTALALALRGLKACTYELNLLPPERIPTRRRGSLRTTLALCFVTALLAGTLVASKVSYNKLTLDSLNDQLQEVKQQVGSLEKVDREFRTLSGFAQRLNRIDRDSPLKIQVLRELGRVLPKDTYVFRIAVARNKLEVQGYSDAASHLIGEIENSPLFRNAAFNGSVVNERAGQKFTIQAEIGEETP